MRTQTTKRKEEVSKRTKGKEICTKHSVGMGQGKTCNELSGSLVDIVVIDSEEEEEEMKDSYGQTSKLGMEGASFPLDEIASEAIREMQEFDRKRKGKSAETPRGPALEPTNEFETEDEEVTVPAKWKRKTEETMDGLAAENATHRTLMKEQREQLIMVVDLVGRMISWMEGKSDSAHQRPTPVPNPREDDSGTIPTPPTATKTPPSAA